jgi:hypothetical protein
VDIYTELQNLLKLYLAKNPEAERDLANKFQVATSTIKRWANGTARPHPRLVQKIVAHIRNK